MAEAVLWGKRGARINTKHESAEFTGSVASSLSSRMTGFMVLPTLSTRRCVAAA